MFAKLRAAFQEAVENFRTEVNRDQIPETVDGLLAGMYREATDAKAYVGKLEKDLAAARARARRESEEAEVCRRRQRQAERIGDEETVRVADEFARKHEERAQVFEGKADAILRELTVCRSDVDEMLEQIKVARRKSDALGATAGRTEARETLGRADDPLPRFRPHGREGLRHRVRGRSRRRVRPGIRVRALQGGEPGGAPRGAQAPDAEGVEPAGSRGGFPLRARVDFRRWQSVDESARATPSMRFSG